MIDHAISLGHGGFPADADLFAQDMPCQGFGILLYLSVLFSKDIGGECPAPAIQFFECPVDMAEFLPKREGTAYGSPVSVPCDILQRQNVVVVLAQPQSRMVQVGIQISAGRTHIAPDHRFVPLQLRRLNVQYRGEVVPANALSVDTAAGVGKFDQRAAGALETEQLQE